MPNTEHKMQSHGLIQSPKQPDKFNFTGSPTRDGQPLTLLQGYKISTEIHPRA